MLPMPLGALDAPRCGTVGTDQTLAGQQIDALHRGNATYLSRAGWLGRRDLVWSPCAAQAGTTPAGPRTCRAEKLTGGATPNKIAPTLGILTSSRVAPSLAVPPTPLWVRRTHRTPLWVRARSGGRWYGGRV